MARASHKDDFSIDVDGIGQFRFGRRTQKDQYKIRGFYGKLTGDNWKEDGTVGDMEAWIHANLEVLIVESPANFSIDKLDPLTDPEDDDRMLKIYSALRKQELSFRPSEKTEGPGTS